MLRPFAASPRLLDGALTVVERTRRVFPASLKAQGRSFSVFFWSPRLPDTFNRVVGKKKGLPRPETFCTDHARTSHDQLEHGHCKFICAVTTQIRQLDDTCMVSAESFRCPQGYPQPVDKHSGICGQTVKRKPSAPELSHSSCKFIWLRARSCSRSCCWSTCERARPVPNLCRTSGANVRGLERMCERARHQTCSSFLFSHDDCEYSRIRKNLLQNLESAECFR